jgi:hypothetical protein
MDARLLTQERQQAEEPARTAWNPGLQSAFLRKLSRALIEIVRRAHRSAATPAGCPLVNAPCFDRPEMALLVRYLPAFISMMGLIAFIAAIVWVDLRGPLVVVGIILLVLSRITARRIRKR